MSELLNKLLKQLADEIDITDSQEGAVKKAYASVASWLNMSDASIAKHKIHIFPQGSLMCGTAIKPINEDDYDIDLVCEFTDMVNNLSPEYVKQSVGKRLKEHDTYKKMLEEKRRCWTLQYCDELNFHMDILPSIPFNYKYTSDRNLFESYRSMQYRRELALLATDKNKSTGKYNFIITNPRGYAEWFKEKMRTKDALKLFASVEHVPSYDKKTVLQKAVQLLKRHRDVYFSNKDDSTKPISMIITTLTAKSYNGEFDLYEFICNALSRMDALIGKTDQGKYVIKNPVMEKENFADKWNEEPSKASAFFEWLAVAKSDFSNLKNVSKFLDYDKLLKQMFAQKPVDRLMKRYESELEKERKTLILEHRSPVLVALEQIKHRITPPWVLPKKCSVIINACVSCDDKKTYKPIRSGMVLPKNAHLIFTPAHTVSQPYRIKWQITNTGQEAFNAHSLRGDKFEDGDIKRFGIPYAKEEETMYSGTHYIQCFIIQNGNQCVGFSEPFIVKVE